MHHPRFRAAVFLAALVVGLVFVPAAAASSLGAPFATLKGTCPAGGYATAKGEPLREAHPDTIGRFSATGGPGGWHGPSLWFKAGDVVFGETGGFNVNDTPSQDVSCSTSTRNVAFTVELFDRPIAPASFDGRVSSATDAGDGDADYFTGSFLPTRAPGAARYVADVSFTQGAVAVCAGSEWGGSDDCTTLASPGTVSLGRVAAGPFFVWLSAEEGPSVDYAVTVRALPVAVTGLTFGGPFSRSGAILQAAYSSDGDTSVTAHVLARDGRIVRTLAAGLPVTEGPHTLTWDGLATGGAALPDGAYTLVLNSSDPSGQASNARTNVTLDSTPPVAEILNPRTPSAPVAVKLVDALSGVAEGAVRLGGTTMTYRKGQQPEMLVPAPQAGWTKAVPRTLTVTAEDGAGNALKREFVIPVPVESATRTRKCRSVSFKRQTDWAAWRIRATGVTCSVARAVARPAKRRVRYKARGFTCRIVGVKRSGLNAARFRCTKRGGRVVRFLLS